MRYYSDELKTFFNSEKECCEAEKKHQAEVRKEKERVEALNANRAARAKEVDEAYANYKKLLAAFLKDYGSFHTTYKLNDLSSFDKFAADLFDILF